ncbi:HD domain-containing protein [Clostridium polynesiense]|uniref:HD domain-containing protein n=1 Tax=Clostridium polynesiense TaxID=1325933 RepID=UPI00058D4770|nr:HD domain-containing protein [Clostridium polynesiense]
MALYRVKQFYWAISSFFKKVDYKYINEHLSPDEIKFFSRLKKGEKLHCIRVSKDASSFYEENLNCFSNKSITKERIIKLGLLHDIGKIKQPLSVIDKSILVILHKITKGDLKKYSNFKKVDIYYNHPIEGVKILKEFGYDDDFLFAVANHHSKIQGDNETLKILSYADNKN